MTEDYTVDFIFGKERSLGKYRAACFSKKDEPYVKVAVHGIPLADFQQESGMEMIKAEVSNLKRAQKQ